MKSLPRQLKSRAVLVVLSLVVLISGCASTSGGGYSVGPRDGVGQVQNGKPIDQKEHSEKLEKAVSTYLDSSKAVDNISLIRIATEFYSSISIAKLNLGWIEGIEIILKHEFLKDIDVDKEKRKQHILELERVQNEIYSEKVRSLQTSEENFDLGRFKK